MKIGARDDQVGIANAHAQDHNPAGIHQAQIAVENIAGNQAAAQEHGDEKIPGDDNAAGQLLFGKRVCRRNREQEHIYCVGHGIQHRVRVRKPDILVFENVLIRFKGYGFRPQVDPAQRRFLGLCNPALSTLIGSRIGYGFMTDLYELKKLEPLIDDELIRGFIAVKREAKRKLSDIILQKEGVEIPPEFVFDIQVKRMHEYKRQLMNALSIVHIYRELKEGRLSDMPPAAFIFGAKAAPGYIMAKNIIKYINELARCINSDPAVRDKLRVVFVSNYNCSYAEHIIPAADISEQISAAGTEASGTGNMKFMINGAVTLGTYDGANIEIVECAGEENNYIFGARVEELTRLRPHYNPRTVYESSSVVRRAVDSLVDDSILNAVYTLPQDSGAKEEARRVFTEVYNSLLTGDWRKPDYYFNLYDLESYIEAKLRAIYDTADERAFARKCLMNTVNSGKFSSDRTIREYSEELWHIRPIPTEE